MSLISARRIHTYRIGTAVSTCRRRFASGAGAPLASNEPSTSSHQPVDVSNHLDSSILSAARRVKFIAPTGFSLSECFERMNELLAQEANAASSVRLGDLLLVSNVLLSNGALSLLADWQLTNLVQSRVQLRPRLPNVFTLIQYLRYLVAAKAAPVSIPSLRRTMEHVPELKISELIEITSLMLRAGIPLGDDRDVIDLLQVVSDRLLDESARDPESLSPKNKANALRFTEWFFTQYSRTLSGPVNDELIRISLTIMRNRNCASVSILEAMIQFAMEHVETKELEMARALAESIKIDQLARWHTVKPLFMNNLTVAGNIDHISKFTGIPLVIGPPIVESNQPVCEDMSGDRLVFSLRDSASPNRPLDEVYVKQSSDWNGRPLYRSEKHSLYYSQMAGSWQVGSDPRRDFIRTAFIISSDPTPPIGIEGWQVYSPSKRSFVSSDRVVTLPDAASLRRQRPYDCNIESKNIGVEVVAEPVAEVGHNQVHECSFDGDQWTDLTSNDVPEAVGHSAPPVESTNVKGMDEMQSRISELSAKVDALERLVSELVSSASSPRVPKLKRMADSLISAIDSTAAPKRAGMIPLGGVPSFDDQRLHLLAQERLSRTSKIIARKLRS